MAANTNTGIVLRQHNVSLTWRLTVPGHPVRSFGMEHDLNSIAVRAELGSGYFLRAESEPGVMVWTWIAL